MMLRTIIRSFRVVPFVLAAGYFFACKEARSGADTFIVPQDTIPTVTKATPGEPPPPPPANRAYYMASNFVIDSAGSIFFYHHEMPLNDDEIRPWDSPPRFIGLRPGDLIMVPRTGIEEFFKQNALGVDSSRRYVSVASAKDTVTSADLAKLIGFCRDKENRIYWKFRIWTEEEKVVTGYKNSGKVYFPRDLPWDTTKIILQPNQK